MLDVMNSGCVLTAIIGNPDEDNKENFRRFISTRGRHPQRKGKERKKKRQENGRTKQREGNSPAYAQITSPLSSHHTHTLVRTTLSLHPRLLSSPLHLLRWRHAQNHPALVRALSLCPSHLASSTFYLKILNAKLLSIDVRVQVLQPTIIHNKLSQKLHHSFNERVRTRLRYCSISTRPISTRRSHPAQPNPSKHPPQLGKQPMKRRTIDHNLQHRVGKIHVAIGRRIFVDAGGFVVESCS